MDPVIQVDRLVKTYQKARKPAVDGISLDVAAGEFFAFLGPNGAGKTTTISILTTTLAKTSGTARIGGHDLDTEAQAVREEIGVLFQKASLDQALSAEENVRLHAAVYGLYPYRPFHRFMPAAYRRQVRELAELMGIADLMGKPVKTLSGGMQRRLEVMRSLMHAPRILFLDEPTQGLDAMSRRALWTHLQQVRKERGTTLFLTTHYIEEAESADRVCVLNHGRIAMLDTPAGLKQRLTGRHLLVDAEDRAALAAELATQPVEVTGAGPLRIAFSTTTAQAIVASLRTPLTLLRIVEPSLEDAYVRLLGSPAEQEAA